jgi:hypothetical protein
MLKRSLLVLLSALFPHVASALDYDESQQGDFSESPDAPLQILLTEGSNRVVGIVDGATDVRDYLTFTIEDGQQLLAIDLVRYQDATLAFVPGNRGFHAIADGSTSYVPDSTTASLFMGGAHLDPLIGDDLLAVLATAPLAGTGFDVPLGPGTYTYHVQQTSPSPTLYEVDFILAVPEPSSALLIGVGLTILSAGWAGRRDTLR